jgi:ABC-type sulfate/molybdate transport systems ATPase subunit
LSLLSIEHATKRYRRGRLERVAVRDVSLELELGELVAVWGARFSGRSTLLRLAAGIELPEEGRVLFEGHDLAHSRNRVLGRRIGYWHASLAAAQHGPVIDQVAGGMLAQRALPKQARRRAQELLFRAGVEHCAHLQCHELAGSEVVRVAIASALATTPALLVIDEPTSGVDLLERDPLLSLLRSIANEGTTVLVSTGDAQGLSGVDRALSMDGGELLGEVRSSEAEVVQLRSAESGAGRW